MRAPIQLTLVLLTVSACGDSDGGATAVRDGRRPSILLISIDTLRADHLGSYGWAPYDEPVSPAIDALAAEGVTFDEYYAPRGQTTPSLCSMMSGKYPSGHGVRDNGQRFAKGQKTLVERLGELGYETFAFVSRIPTNEVGHPARGAHVIEGGSKHPDGTKAVGQNESDAIVADKALAWLESEQPGAERPFFGWVHFYAVHKPYSPPPPYDTMFTGDYAGALKPGKKLHPGKVVAELNRAALEQTALSEEDHRFVLALYDGGIRSTDRHVARLVEKLEERGLAEETIVIVTSDHGEELGEHQNYYFHGNSVYDGTLRIPLIVRWPGHLAPGSRFPHLTQNVDLVPTLLDWIGVEVPEELEGVSLAPWLVPGAEPEGIPREYAFLEWQDMIWGVRTPEFKYIINPDGVHPKKPPYFGEPDASFQISCAELYEISSDPAEQHNRVEELEQRALELRGLTLEHRARPGAIRGWGEIQAEAIAKLRELGYAGSLPGREDLVLGAEDCDRRSAPEDEEE